VPFHPAGITVSNHALITVSDALRHRRALIGTRWRKLPAGRQALLVVAYLRKGETYADLAAGFAIGVTTVFSYIQEALDALAAIAPSLHDAVIAATGKAFVIVDGTLLRIDRIGMATGRDRHYYSGKHKFHGMNVQAIADPAGRLIWASPALPAARHDMSAVREHGSLTPCTPPRSGCPPTTATAEPVPPSRFPNNAAASTPTPGATGRCRTTRKRPAQEIRCCPHRTTEVKAVLVHAG
jgi:hypothetical protein